MIRKICFMLFTFLSLSLLAQDKYKCMIQMTNYTGESAYMVVSLIDPEGHYQKTIVLNLERSLLDKGYKIRFESAVEDQYYYTTDAEVPFSSEGLKSKTEGTGYIRYVRIIEVK